MLLSASLLLFGYELISCLIFKGVPTSLSDTFYLYNAKVKDLGWVFTLVLWSVAILTLIPTLDLFDGKWYQPFTFLMCGALGFVGAAPHFKDSEAVIHEISALIAATLALCLVAITGEFVGVPPAIFVSFIGFYGCTLFKNPYGVSIIFWLEQAAFISLFLTLLTLQHHASISC